MAKKLLMILTLFLVLPLFGCQSTVPNTVPYEEVPMKAPTPNWESQEEIARVEKPLYIAINSPSDLTTHLDIKPKDPVSNPWPPNELKQIDFEKKIGIFLTLGLKRSGGMSLQVEKIQRKENNVYMRIKIKDAFPNSPRPGVIQYGVKLLKLSKEHLPKGNVKFIFTDQDGNILNQQEVTL